MADDNKRIHFIPPLPPKREKRVGIYCRVSTSSADQLKSLTVQVSALTRLTAANHKWLLVDVYIDIASSKTDSSRREFSRMLQDCKSRDIEIILTKSISRFGRDTVEILDALNQLRVLGVRVIFEQEVLDTADTDNDLMISIIEAVAQAENESRSDNIKCGIKRHAAQGTSKLYNRKCYGYINDAYYLADNNNPVIISKETFQAMQIEKQHRSNVTEGEKGNHRKGKKISSKK